jgi:hypothetical protein
MTPLNPRAEQNEKKTEKRKCGRDDVGEDSEVGIAAGGKEVQGEQQDERKETPQRNDHARKTQPIAEEAKLFLRFWRLAAHQWKLKSWFPLVAPLFFESANIGHKRFDFIVRQLVAIGIHLLFAIFHDAFLDAFDGDLVLQFGLDLRVAVILDAEFLAHLGLAFAIRAVAFGARLVPILFGIRRVRSGDGGNDYPDDE